MRLGRMSPGKRYAGDLAGEARVGLPTALTAVAAAADYVASERVSGTLAGRKGGFVFQRSGAMGRGVRPFSVAAVPGAGPGVLAATAGSFRIRNVEGRHDCEFEHALR